MVDSEQPKLHPVVELMIDRMGSHPEEFNGNDSRWEEATANIEQYAVGADRVAYETAVAKLWLDYTHTRVMDELLNGEERRREERERAEAEAKHLAHTRAYMNKQQAGLNQAMLAQSYGQAQQLGQYQNLYNNPSLTGTAVPPTSYLSTTSAVEQLTTDPNMLAKLKRALGI